MKPKQQQKQKAPARHLPKFKIGLKKKKVTKKLVPCFVKLDRQDLEKKIAEMKKSGKTVKKSAVLTSVAKQRKATSPPPSNVTKKPPATGAVQKSSQRTTNTRDAPSEKHVSSPATKPSPSAKSSPNITTKASTVASTKASPVVSAKKTAGRPKSSPVISGAKSAAKAPRKSIIAIDDKAALKHLTPISSKRTPKPNRRYMNDEIVSKIPTSVLDDSTTEEESSANEEDNEVEEEIVVRKPQKQERETKKLISKSNKRDKNVDLSEDEDEDESPSANRRLKSNETASNSEPPRKRGRPGKDEIIARVATTVQKSKEVAKVVTAGLKRKLDPDTDHKSNPLKKALFKKKPRQERPIDFDEYSDESDDDISRVPTTQERPRKVQSSSNVAPTKKHPVQVGTAATSSQKSTLKPVNTITSTQLAAKRSALSATLKQKLNTSAPAAQTLDRSLNKSATKPSLSANHTPINTPKLFGNKRLIRSPSPVPVRSKQPPLDPDDLEDFEQMPTFTIVNINDIINQKEDVVVIEKKPKQPVLKRKTAKEIEDEVEYHPSAESDQEDHEIDQKRGPYNRRKPQLLPMRSEKTKATTITNSASNNNIRTPPKILNNTLARPNRNAIKPAAAVIPSAKGAPRILNSSLCRNTQTVEPRVLNDTLNNNNNVANNNRPNGAMVKTFSNKRLGQKTTPPPTKTVISQQVVQGGTTRRVRKITCFETWFVIKLPAEEQQTHMAELSMSLIKLGNDIKEVTLPSDQWSYNISLLRRSTVYKKPSDDPVDEIYTGEVQDANIKPEERHLYVPTNIMFRRKSQNSALRMQFDRAVIFKNKKFYINIEGKNVKLLAAPMVLDCMLDIETLLQIVNELSLQSSLVEQTSYIA